MHAFLRYESILEYLKARQSEAKMFNVRCVESYMPSEARRKNYGVKKFVDLSYSSTFFLAGQILEVYGQQETGGKTLDFGILAGLQIIASEWEWNLLVYIP